MAIAAVEKLASGEGYWVRKAKASPWMAVRLSDNPVFSARGKDPRAVVRLAEFSRDQ
jgi:hypothetical protein